MASKFGVTIQAKRQHARVQKSFIKPSLTRQEMRDDCDINVLVKRHKLDPLKLGVILGPMSEVARYGDFSGVTSFQQAMEQVQQAEDSFMELPSELRDHFDNDPSKLMDFSKRFEGDQLDLEAIALAREYGLLPPLPAPNPLKGFDAITEPPVESESKIQGGSPPPDQTSS